MTDADYATISGGTENKVTGDTAVVAGGMMNTVAGKCSTVLGGKSSLAKGMYIAHSGGASNKVWSNYASTTGGYKSEILGRFSTIVGSGATEIRGHHSLSLGSSNRLMADYAAIFGFGEGNCVSGYSDAIHMCGEALYFNDQFLDWSAFETKSRRLKEEGAVEDHVMEAEAEEIRRLEKVIESLEQKHAMQAKRLDALLAARSSV